jgi:MarR family transcriptional regulator, lower aerobic nicotinate degradation pathway regulator
VDAAPNPPARLWDFPTWLLKQAAGHAHRIVLADITAAGARKDHFAVLTALAELGAASQADVGRRLGLDRSDISALMDELEAQGLVTRERDAEDRRRNVVRLTARGAELQQELDAIVAAAQERMLEPLDEADREALTALLARLVEHHGARFTSR